MFKLPFEYLINILKNWWGIIGALLGLYGLFNDHLKLSLPEINQWYFYGVALALLYVSGFLVWLQERKRRLDTEEKNKDFVDYEVQVTLVKVEPDYQHIESIVSEQLDEINNLFTEVSSEKESHIRKAKNNNQTMLAAAIIGKKDYIGELDKYLQELSVCKEVVKEYAIKYRELFDSSFLHLYEANFDIFNKGSMYDEKIEISIALDENSSAIAYSDLISKLPDMPELPNKPVFEMDFSIDSIFSSSGTGSKSYLELIENMQSVHSFYQNKEILSNFVSMTIRELRAGADCDMLGGKLFLNIQDPSNLKFKINSMKTRSEIEKNILVKNMGSKSLQDSLFDEHTEWA